MKNVGLNLLAVAFGGLTLAAEAADSMFDMLFAALTLAAAGVSIASTFADKLESSSNNLR